MFVSRRTEFVRVHRVMKFKLSIEKKVIVGKSTGLADEYFLSIRAAPEHLFV